MVVSNICHSKVPSSSVGIPRIVLSRWMLGMNIMSTPSTVWSWLWPASLIPQFSNLKHCEFYKNNAGYIIEYYNYLRYFRVLLFLSPSIKPWTLLSVILSLHPSLQHKTPFMYHNKRNSIVGNVSDSVTSIYDLFPIVDSDNLP